LRSAVVPDLFTRKRNSFVLWRPGITAPVPELVIGQLAGGNPPQLNAARSFPLMQVGGHPDLWTVPAADCGLTDGGVYHYWFAVQDTAPHAAAPAVIHCTDPLAWTVDWRLLAPRLPDPYGEQDRQPASVVKYVGGQLRGADLAGEEVSWAGEPTPDTLPPNNELVIYELPTRWVRTGRDVALGVGTFRDARALLDSSVGGANFADLHLLDPTRAYLTDLGVNALELLPPADSVYDREWGYGTTNYFSADCDLGFPYGNSWPTATTDLANLVASCHSVGMRFFYDAVMAFADYNPYTRINYLDFFVDPASNDPELVGRDAFGGTLFKYRYVTSGYDPVSGNERPTLERARQFMVMHLTRWINDFHIDGIRVDSVPNIADPETLGELNEQARTAWRDRYPAAARGGDADARFLVVGEDLSEPLTLIEQNRIDALWHESFKRRLRNAIIGSQDTADSSFGDTVEKLVDCRRVGYADGSQAVNYITSHDVEGWRNERIYSYLENNGVFDTEPRIKLAFACLLTALGIPMILAGEEFACPSRLSTHDPDKQLDALDWGSLEDAWRARIKGAVSRLVLLRTSSPSLRINDTSFLLEDFNDDKRVIVWQRGPAPGAAPVVVVANFSDWGTPDPTNPNSVYEVPNWPTTPPGAQWREVMLDRQVPPAWIGREPLFPWEAKVYTY
jgi:pullulanase